MAGEGDIKLFAKQNRVYPKRTQGRFRRIKWIVMIVTLGIYYLAPWLRWDRGAHAPDQAILIDMEARRAYFFFIEIWPQEVYYLTGILILAALGLFFVTSLFGRVWCGYLCFQTVWTDLFVWVERLVQGDRNARMRLDKAPMSFNKFFKKLTTHIIWIFIGFCTGGAWVFYFNDAPTLMEQFIHLDVPWSVMAWVIALTFTTYLMAGFAREQVCIYMCPYARFQSAMFDKDSLIIGYDEKRGEKRGKHKKGDSWDNRGHCIECKACVQVCPTGIDIRDGLQMECIACGMCVDACDDIMDKLELPRGLVRYDTVHNQEMRAKGKKERSHLLRPRTIYYTLVLTLVSGLMLFSLLIRSELELNVLHDRNPLFVKLSNGDIRNGYDIKILNKTHEDRVYELSFEGLDKAKIKVQGALSPDIKNLPVFADSVGHFRVFVTAPKQKEVRKEVVFNIVDKENNNTKLEESIFVSDKLK